MVEMSSLWKAHIQGDEEVETQFLLAKKKRAKRSLCPRHRRLDIEKPRIVIHDGDLNGNLGVNFVGG